MGTVLMLMLLFLWLSSSFMDIDSSVQLLLCKMVFVFMNMQ